MWGSARYEIWCAVDYTFVSYTFFLTLTQGRFRYSNQVTIIQERSDLVFFIPDDKKKSKRQLVEQPRDKLWQAILGEKDKLATASKPPESGTKDKQGLTVDANVLRLDEDEAARLIQAAIRGRAARRPPGLPESSSEEEQEVDVGEARDDIQATNSHEHDSMRYTTASKDISGSPGGRSTDKSGRQTMPKSKRREKPSRTRVYSPARVDTDQLRIVDALERLQRQFRAASYSATGMDISRLFSHYDRDNSGQISFEEFRRATRCDAKITKLEVTDELLRDIFNAIDSDMSGTIGLQEFEGLLLGLPDAVGASASSDQWLSYTDTRRVSRILQSPQRRLGDEYATQ